MDKAAAQPSGRALVRKVPAKGEQSARPVRSSKFEPVSEILKQCDDKAGNLFQPGSAYA